MMHSIIVGCLKMGMSVSVACPEGYRPDKEVLDFASQYDGFEMTDSPATAAKDADVCIYNVWASMGQEGEAAERRKAFEGYQINAELMKLAKPDAMVQHCLPAHRGEEDDGVCYLKLTQMRFLMKQKIVCMHKKQYWLL